MTDQPPVDPGATLQLGLAFWGSKTLLSAVELGVFTTLAEGPQTREHLQTRLGLHPRAAADFLDSLVALGMLDRTGPAYANTLATAQFLDRNKPSYVGGILEMANARLYPFWGALTAALETGRPQSEVARGEDFFGALYANGEALAQFLRAMTGISMGVALRLAESIRWDRYGSVADIGTAEGCVPVQIALRHPHLSATGFDLPPVQPVFEKYVASFGLTERVSFEAGDFFTDPLPRADVLVMGRILHDWGLDEKLELLRKAYEALPDGGSLIVYDTVLDDDRRENAFGLLMSLNMLIETDRGFDYTGRDCLGWLAQVGFRDGYVQPLVGPDSMVVAIK
ncbi:MAG: methyltransferase [Micromonosporaceae bacterium]